MEILSKTKVWRNYDVEKFVELGADLSEQTISSNC